MDPLRVLNEQHGFFTRAEALEHGYDDHAIQRALRARSWQRIRVGAYTFADLWPDSAERLLSLRGRAVFRKLGPAVALSHTSAALEHQLRLWDADLSKVHVTRLDGGSGRSESGVEHHEGLTLATDLVERNGLLLTAAARAAIEAASLVRRDAGLGILDSAVQLGICSNDDLTHTYGLLEHWPHLQGVGPLVRMADGGAQSVGESRSRYLFFCHGLPAPQTQFKVEDEHGVVVAATDFGWPEHRAVGEFDGRVKYGRLLLPGQDPGDVVFAEKKREDMIRDLLPGWSVIRLTWSDLSVPARTAERVRARLFRRAA
jgi:hypothetical protein